MRTNLQDSRVIEGVDLRVHEAASFNKMALVVNRSLDIFMVLRILVHPDRLETIRLIVKLIIA